MLDYMKELRKSTEASTIMGTDGRRDNCGYHVIRPYLLSASKLGRILGVDRDLGLRGWLQDPTGGNLHLFCLPLG